MQVWVEAAVSAEAPFPRRTPVRDENMGAFVKVCVPAKTFEVVVPNAVEMAGVAPPEEIIGYIPVTDVTPPVVQVEQLSVEPVKFNGEDTVVFCRSPLALVERTAPVFDVNHVTPCVARVVEALEKIFNADHVLAVVVPKARANVPVVVIGPPVIGYVVFICVTEPLPPLELIVIGELPKTTKGLHDVFPEHVTEVVAVVANAFVPPGEYNIPCENVVCPVPPCTTRNAAADADVGIAPKKRLTIIACVKNVNSFLIHFLGHLNSVYTRYLQAKRPCV